MDYVWKVHKKFLITVGGGILGLILYNAFVLSGLRAAADQATRRLDEERQNLEDRMKKGEPTDDILRQAEGARDHTVKQLASLTVDVAFRPPDRFKRPDSGARAYMENLKLNLPKELHAAAVKARVSCPEKVGLDDAFPDEMAEEVLLRLAVLERVVTAALAAGVEKIEALDAMHGVDQKLVPSAVPGAFVNRFSVLIKFTGKSESVFKLVHSLQRKGQFLGLSHFEYDRPNTTKDLLSATLVATAFKVDEKGAINPRPAQ